MSQASTTSSAPSWVWWSGMLLAFVLAGVVTSVVILLGVLVFVVGAGVALSTGALRGRSSLQALALACAGNAFICGHSLWLFTYPAHLSLRPMIWNFEVLLVGLGCALGAAVLGARSVWKERQLLLPAVAFVAALEAILLGWQILAVAARIRGLQIAD